MKLKRIFSVQARGINGITVKQITVTAAVHGKKGLNLPFFELKLSIIIERMGARRSPTSDPIIPKMKTKPDDTLK